MKVKFSDSVISLLRLKDWLQQLTNECEIVQFQIITEHRFQRIKGERRNLPDRYTCVALVKPKKEIYDCVNNLGIVDTIKL